MEHQTKAAGLVGDVWVGVPQSFQEFVDMIGFFSRKDPADAMKTAQSQTNEYMYFLNETNK